MKVNDIDMDAVILGNGEYPTHSMPETMLIMAPYVVCCDGSADEHIRRGFTPDAIIGDGDSLSPENKERFRTADRLYESRSAGNDADGPRNVYSGIGAELFQVISRTANLHLQLQRHRTEDRWAGISAQ